MANHDTAAAVTGQLSLMTIGGEEAVNDDLSIDSDSSETWSDSDDDQSDMDFDTLMANISNKSTKEDFTNGVEHPHLKGERAASSGTGVAETEVQSIAVASLANMTPILICDGTPSTMPPEDSTSNTVSLDEWQKQFHQRQSQIADKVNDQYLQNVKDLLGDYCSFCGDDMLKKWIADNENICEKLRELLKEKGLACDSDVEVVDAQVTQVTTNYSRLQEMAVLALLAPLETELYLDLEQNQPLRPAWIKKLSQDEAANEIRIFFERKQQQQQVLVLAKDNCYAYQKLKFQITRGSRNDMVQAVKSSLRKKWTKPRNVNKSVAKFLAGYDKSGAVLVLCGDNSGVSSLSAKSDSTMDVLSPLWKKLMEHSQDLQLIHQLSINEDKIRRHQVMVNYKHKMSAVHKAEQQGLYQEKYAYNYEDAKCAIQDFFNKKGFKAKIVFLFFIGHGDEEGRLQFQDGDAATGTELVDVLNQANDMHKVLLQGAVEEIYFVWGQCRSYMAFDSSNIANNSSAAKPNSNVTTQFDETDESDSYLKPDIYVTNPNNNRPSTSVKQVCLANPDKESTTLSAVIDPKTGEFKDAHLVELNKFAEYHNKLLMTQYSKNAVSGKHNDMGTRVILD